MRVGDFADRLEIAGRGDGKAGLDHVDAQVDQRLGDFHFLRQVHTGAGRLLAVAERGVENDDQSVVLIGLCLTFDCLPENESVIDRMIGTSRPVADPWSARATPTMPSMRANHRYARSHVVLIADTLEKSAVL